MLRLPSVERHQLAPAGVLVTLRTIPLRSILVRGGSCGLGRNQLETLEETPESTECVLGKQSPTC